MYPPCGLAKGADREGLKIEGMEIFKVAKLAFPAQHPYFRGGFALLAKMEKAFPALAHLPLGW